LRLSQNERGKHQRYISHASHTPPKLRFCARVLVRKRFQSHASLLDSAPLTTA
jgi:hypothetical protein